MLLQHSTIALWLATTASLANALDLSKIITTTLEHHAPHAHHQDYMTFGYCDKPEGFTQVPINKNDPPLIASMKLKGLELVFSTKNPNAAIATSKGIEIKVNLPSSFNTQGLKTYFKGAKADIEMRLPHQISDNIVGIMHQKSFSSASGSSANGIMSMDLDQVLMDGRSNTKGFADFLKRVTFAEGGKPYNFRMSGEAMTKVDFNGNGNVNPIHNICLGNIPFNVNIDTISGLGGLNQAKVVGVPQVVRGTKDKLILNLDMELYNPSNVRLVMGTIVFDMIYSQEKVGKVIVPNVTLEAGKWNRYKGEAVYRPETDAQKQVGVQMLSAFSSGKNESVSVYGSTTSSNISCLKHALEDVRITTTLPSPQNQPLINKAFFHFPNIFTRKAKVYIIAYNPFEVPVTMTKIKAKMAVGKSELGRIDQEVNFVIPSKQSVRSSNMSLACSISLNSIKAIWNSLFKDIDVTVESEMEMKVGEYFTPLMYTQHNVSTRFVR